MRDAVQLALATPWLSLAVAWLLLALFAAAVSRAAD